MRKKRLHQTILHKLLSLRKKKYFPLVLIVAATLLLALLRSSQSNAQANYPELKELVQTNRSFIDLSTYFSALSKKKGAEYAYQVLRVAPLPSGTDVHLLGHVVGDILYKQRGASGIKICTQDFRNACSHSVVVGLFNDQGPDALNQIAEACRKSPGGTGAYTMCFHGLGHGILAYYGYDMAKADEVCQKTSTPAFNNREGVECVGGTVMEIISGGGHDPDKWQAANKLYLTADRPLGLCQNSFIPAAAKSQCYVYLTPFLFVASGGDLASPTEANFKKAFTFCEAIPSEEKDNRDACFGGFGKEFIVLAQGRDIRKIGDLNESQLRQVYDWCMLATPKEGRASCNISAVNSMYWGGENNYQTPIKFCLITNDEYQKNSCFVNLIGAVFYYRKDKSYLSEFCRNLPNPYQTDCISQLGRLGRI